MCINQDSYAVLVSVQSLGLVRPFSLDLVCPVPCPLPFGVAARSSACLSQSGGLLALLLLLLCGFCCPAPYVGVPSGVHPWKGGESSWSGVTGGALGGVVHPWNGGDSCWSGVTGGLTCCCRRSGVWCCSAPVFPSPPSVCPSPAPISGSVW